MRLTKQSGYALRIVVECAAAGKGLARIADIAERYQITKYNISKTVPILVRHGIIVGVRGRKGGIRLAKPPSEIKVGDVIRATETTHIVADCFGGESVECAIRPAAPINQMLDSALEAFIAVLDEHTVEDLLAGRTPMGGIMPAGGGERRGPITHKAAELDHRISG